MEMSWSDPSVQSAMIEAVGGIVIALVAAVFGWVAAIERKKRKQLEKGLVLALQDIEFLLEVEAAHCDLHKETLGQSNKLRMRRVALAHGLLWSGKYTPGRMRKIHAHREAAREVEPAATSG